MLRPYFTALNMKRVTVFKELPYQPAVYAVYFNDRRSAAPVYVGSTIALRDKLSHQFRNRKTIQSLRPSASDLRGEFSLEVLWWEHPDFAETSALEAAEIIAFATLNSSQSGNGSISEEAKQHIVNDSFREKMGELFRGEPSGMIVFSASDFNN